MVRDNFQPRRHRPPFQTVALPQFNARHVLQHGQHGVFIDFAGTDLRIAMRAILQDQIEGRNRGPELKIAHRLQPGFHIIDVSEVFHASILAGAVRRLQISCGKRGQP